MEFRSGTLIQVGEYFLLLHRSEEEDGLGSFWQATMMRESIPTEDQEMERLVTLSES